MIPYTLGGIAFSLLRIDGMGFLIPVSLRPFERSVHDNIKKIIGKLRKAGWYDYVLTADMLTVIMPSPQNGQFALLRSRPHEFHQPLFFTDSGGLQSTGILWSASLFVHEATHVFQKYYFSKHVRDNDHRLVESDACRMQARFLRRMRCTRLARYLMGLLKEPRGFWEWYHTEAINKDERYSARRHALSERIYKDLRRLTSVSH